MADVRGDGFCITCGGHGSLMGPEIPRQELSPRRQQGYDSGRRYLRSLNCPDCDGYDHATPYAEFLADL